MRCHSHKGHWMPGCMGVAAASGCGKTPGEAKSYCTCPPKSKDDDDRRLLGRVDALENEVAELRELREGE